MLDCVCFAPEMKWYCCTTDPPVCPVNAPKDGAFCCNNAGPLACDFSCAANLQTHCDCGMDNSWHCKQTACAVDGGQRG